MDLKIIISEKPHCKTCNRPMHEWNAFAYEHEHIECASNRIVASLIELVKHDLNKHE